MNELKQKLPELVGLCPSEINAMKGKVWLITAGMMLFLRTILDLTIEEFSYGNVFFFAISVVLLLVVIFSKEGSKPENGVAAEKAWFIAAVIILFLDEILDLAIEGFTYGNVTSLFMGVALLTYAMSRDKGSKSGPDFRTTQAAMHRSKISFEHA